MEDDKSSETQAPKPQAPPPNSLTGIVDYGEGVVNGLIIVVTK
jgi:hypothetical protein